MKLEGNTIFITGGTSGIGRALAEALHRRGNQVIIAGRRKANLDAIVRENPGMDGVELDITDPKSIAAVAAHLTAKYPKLNVLVNNAGVMVRDDVSGAVDEAVLVSTIETNLLGPVRTTSAFIEHLKKQREATIINVSSVLGFVPLAQTAVYSSTKAAIHSYSQSLRYRLRNTSVRVLELAPPWVQTELMNGAGQNEPRAMPLADFVKETMALLATDAEEIVVENARALRANPGAGEGPFVTAFNDDMSFL
ncbi:SDR family oxidoreductase [Polyangium aurulentum]|uniref:SDR family oxidoreductase n=1 Tax=Polyangium aurulentum TaxID=2567896 RepID=UPI0010AE2B20|nr:SDR family NAD(P)-dependent oxidoreductase [Polyangium aurulentum]UQA58512.1 SDR family NAD(P)-dependent oxidoreductase [Polyangium aurulentum]